MSSFIAGYSGQQRTHGVSHLGLGDWTGVLDEARAVDLSALEVEDIYK